MPCADTCFRESRKPGGECVSRVGCGSGNSGGCIGRQKTSLLFGEIYNPYQIRDHLLKSCVVMNYSKLILSQFCRIFLLYMTL